MPGPSNITPGGDEPPPTPSSSSNEEQQLKEWNWGSGDQSPNIKNYYIFLMNINVEKVFFSYHTLTIQRFQLEKKGSSLEPLCFGK